VKQTFALPGIAADPEQAASLRGEFAHWLDDDLGLGREFVADATLAVYEALSNAVEHAYRAAARSNLMDLHAEYDPATTDLVVTVTDYGAWRAQKATGRRTGGRGLDLMRALADRVAVETSNAGTRARLSWSHIATCQRGR
jgi:anti-sigma regulatory factor (Ser/Thr protein kinase)